MKIVWHKCHRPRVGYETFHRDQYFRLATYNGGASYGLWTTQKRKKSGLDRNRRYLGDFCCTCQKCGYNREVAIREFKPNKLTRTKFVAWTQCAFGHCNRLTFRINELEHLFWAEYVPGKRKVSVFSKHCSLKPIGHISTSLVPASIRKAIRESKKKT